MGGWVILLKRTFSLEIDFIIYHRKWIVNGFLKLFFWVGAGIREGAGAGVEEYSYMHTGVGGGGKLFLRDEKK